MDTEKGCMILISPHKKSALSNVSNSAIQEKYVMYTDTCNHKLYGQMTDSFNCKYVTLCNWTRNFLPQKFISICVSQTFKNNISRDNHDVARVHRVHIPCIHASQTSKTDIQTSHGMTKDWTGKVKVAIYRYTFTFLGLHFSITK